MTPASGLRQGAIVGFAGGTVAGLVYGVLTVGPSIASSALIGALGGLSAGLAWIVVHRLGRVTAV